MMSDYLDLVQSYARLGMAHWDRAQHWVKMRAIECLQGAIVEKEHELTQTIKATSRGAWDDRFKFIPTPNVNHNGIAQGFFLPIREDAQRGLGQVSYDLFLIVDNEHCLGYRFEPADKQDSTHDYCHVQMNQRMFRESLVVTGIPGWLPTSYPAFPMRSDNPIQMFLWMAACIHGYGKEHDRGILGILKEIYRNKPLVSERYSEEVRKILN